ncbi:MAG: nitroreductase family protein [Chloroflexota bacterium]
MTDARTIPLAGYRDYTPDEMQARAHAFYEQMNRRRTIRDFSDRPVPHEVIADCIRAAGTAPSGANQQPWHFAAVSNPDIKREIRIAAEKEEYEFYHGRAPDDWLGALSHLGTNERKPFLEKAPWLIGVFGRSYGLDADGSRIKHYYVTESVGIATGLLVTAMHHAGLATLTHTPSPMRFLNQIMQRPDNERPFVLLVVGYPADDVRVPDIQRKPLDEIATFFE